MARNDSIDILSEAVGELRQQICKETDERQTEYKKLSDRIAALKMVERDEDERFKMLGRLATTTQFFMAEKFSCLFSRRYAYNTSIEEIYHKIYSEENKDTSSIATYQSIIDLFTAEGVLEEDIPHLIQSIREVGTSNSILPIEIINTMNVEQYIDAAEMAKIIDEVPLSATVKADATILLRVLVQLQDDASLPLLTTAHKAP